MPPLVVHVLLTTPFYCKRIKEEVMSLKSRKGTRRKPSNETDRTVPSAERLAKVAVIKESSMQYLVQLSDSEEENDGEDRPEYSKLVEKTLNLYYTDLRKDTLGTQEVLSGAVLIATSSCLICLSSIKRIDAVWNCIQCYRLFHLRCIQQWAVDGVKQPSILSPELFPNQQRLWSCPNCRSDYSQSQCPKVYKCFCGKLDNPPVDPWLLPHSCGEICGRQLKPECGHYCVSLCHPGACPPCPKTISFSCYCGRSANQMRRCGSRGWSCGRTCRKELSCGEHICEAICHEGPCSECEYTVDQPCLCGRQTKERRCRDLDWQCETVCRRKLDCGNHFCEKVCHSGECGPCPRSGERTCPCGKTNHTLPCTEDVPVCGDTCGKPLPCKIHMCMRLCHYGDCGQCLQVTRKKCRCGKKEKQVSCSSEYLCDARCSQLRQCGRHQCRRKCCDGNCPPCEQVCGRQLLCRNHKCASPCHTGQCYPCTQVVAVTCHCGHSSVTVPCGREKRTKPPSCHLPCSCPPSCHHNQRPPHRCHFGRCPPCKEPCLLPLECGHNCRSVCHSEPITVSVAQVVSATVPWSKVSSAPSQQQVVRSCPPCTEPVQRPCKGEHELQTFPCSQVRVFTCGRVCGRRLSCGNHVCQRGCHEVIDPLGKDQAGSDCMSCDLECQNPRPSLCSHSCPLPCHPGECPPCQLTIRMRCHCATMNLVIACREWTSVSEKERVSLQACNNQCTKLLSCGHRCPKQCHDSECSDVKMCTKKVTLRCPCKRLKKDAKCNEQDNNRLQCDKECLRILKEKQEERKRLESEKLAAIEREKKEAEEALLRQLQGRPKKKRKRRDDVEEKDENGWWNYKLQVVATVVVVAVLVAIGYWWTINNSI